jgi:hypothetical protein
LRLLVSGTRRLRSAYAVLGRPAQMEPSRLGRGTGASSRGAGGGATVTSSGSRSPQRRRGDRATLAADTECSRLRGGTGPSARMVRRAGGGAAAAAAALGLDRSRRMDLRDSLVARLSWRPVISTRRLPGCREIGGWGGRRRLPGYDGATVPFTWLNSSSERNGLLCLHPTRSVKVGTDTSRAGQGSSYTR